jgi:sialate O-acetylesterase
MSVSTPGGATLHFDNVLVGEVWLLSGQSNMEWPVRRSTDGDLDALAGHHPHLRLFRVDRAAQIEPRFSSSEPWRISSPEHVLDFSAVGYHFGILIHQALQVPVGLIQVAWGGTPAIAWTRPSVFDRHPSLVRAAAEWEEGMKTFPEDQAAYERAAAAYRAGRNMPPNAPLPRNLHPDAPQPPRYNPTSIHRPGIMTGGMLHPIAPYAARGILWYQGETDTGFEPRRYHERLQVLFSDWRDWWENPNLVLGIVQLASFLQPKPEPSDDPWPNLRDSQRRFTDADPLAGLVSTLDVGEADDIHPMDKITVGRRLARWALADVYKRLDLAGGPEPISATADAEGRVTITFRQVGGGLHAFNGPTLGGFTLGGEDGVFHKAEATLSQDRQTVIVSSPEVPAPTTVRYAWQNNPIDANLANRERLPSPTFELAIERPLK